MQGRRAAGVCLLGVSYFMLTVIVPCIFILPWWLSRLPMIAISNMSLIMMLLLITITLLITVIELQCLHE
jgi:hypothetical protein